MTFFQFIFQKNVQDENKGFYEMLANRIRGRKIFPKINRRMFHNVACFYNKKYSVVIG